MKSPTIHTRGTMNPTAAVAQSCLVFLILSSYNTVYTFRPLLLLALIGE
jgi:hypothetical protein